MDKITKREMFEAIIEAMETGEWKYGVDSMREFCQKEIETLNKRAEKAKIRAAEKRAEKDELAEIVFAALTEDEFSPIATIVAKVNDPDMTTQRVTYRLTKLVEAGRVEKQEISIPGADGQKARRVQGYRALPVNITE